MAGIQKYNLCGPCYRGSKCFLSRRISMKKSLVFSLVLGIGVLAFGAGLRTEAAQDQQAPQGASSAPITVSLDPLPEIPPQLLKRLLAMKHIDKQPANPKIDLDGCTTGNNGDSCTKLAVDFMFVLHDWKEAEAFRTIAHTLATAAERRSCAFGEVLGCSFYAESLWLTGRMLKLSRYCAHASTIFIARTRLID